MISKKSGPSIIESSDTNKAGAKFDKDPHEGVVTVRPSEETMTRQGLPQFVGVSEDTAGAKGICMQLMVVPPGAAAEPHLHAGHETAIYVLEGRVETHYGPDLQYSVINVAGDFVYIAPDVRHQPVNISDTERAVAVVARNDAREQEHVYVS